MHGLKLTGELKRSDSSTSRAGLEVGGGVLDRVLAFSRARSDAIQVMEGSHTRCLGEDMTESYVTGELQCRMPNTCATAYYCEWYRPYMWHYLDPTGKTAERIQRLQVEEVRRTKKSSDAQLEQTVQVGQAAQQREGVRERYRDFIKTSAAETMGEDAAEAHLGFRSFEMLYAARRINRMSGNSVNLYCGIHHMWDIEDVAGDPGFEERYLAETVPELAECHRNVIVPFYDRVDRQFNANRDMYPAEHHRHFLQWLLAERAIYATNEFVVDQEVAKATSAQAAAMMGLRLPGSDAPQQSQQDRRKRKRKQKGKKKTRAPAQSAPQTIDPSMIPLMIEVLLPPIRLGDFARVAGREWTD